ncbi:uncharacterized protein RJT20DRAFT_127186 [Scheffersomyces xylosifermentans]|uniref:uncharacterized protein n=1 Tax=Scheffersomyces xylosifermentans TaxID=1304137 RepID=UPI00315C6EA5
MSKQEKLQSEVVERPDDMEVEPPTEPHTHIQPFEFLKIDDNVEERTALMILNQSLHGLNLRALWKRTNIHICADGGANQLFDYFQDKTNESSTALREQYIPNYIVGDFDSLRDDVRSYYEIRGTRVIEQTSQYSTDFMKAMSTIQLHFHSDTSRKHLREGEINNNNGIDVYLDTIKIVPSEQSDIKIYILSGIGGRFDQTIHSISQLYQLNSSHSHLQLFFLTKDDLIFLLKKGKNYISYPAKSSFHHARKVPVCGLLPLGNSTIMLSSYGLKYDVSNWESRIAGNVSSSNGLSGINGVIVDSSDPIVMNIEINLELS